MGPTSSPWSSFAGAGAHNASGPLSPAFNNAAGPGAIGSASYAPGSATGSSSLAGPGHAGQPDPWSRAPSSWDRARYAFEQPGGNGTGGTAGLGSIGGVLHGAQQQPPHAHHMSGASAGNTHHSLMGPGPNPFGLGTPVGGPPGPRNLFGPPGSGAGHPGAIGALPSALSPTSSAASRHLSGKHD